MRSLVVILLALAALPAFSQTIVEKNIEVGMFIRIMPCKKGADGFTTMDLYTKTRYLRDTITVDSLTGEGIFERFFNPGDFDAKPLSCAYGNKYYKVAALRLLEDKEGNEKRVMICYTSNPLAVIWVEFDKATETKEIEFLED